MGAVELFWKITAKMDAKRLASQKAADGVIEYNDIPYIEDRNNYHKLDVYRPADRKGEKLPVIMDIHGGGWYYGDKDLNKKYCLHLAKFGFAVVNISYRLTAEVGYADQLLDCAAALNKIPELAEQYNMDLDRLFITGDSAGGHLAALLASAVISEKVGKAFGISSDLKIRALCLTCPALDITPIARFPGAGIYLKRVIGEGYKKSPFFPLIDVSAVIPDNFPPVLFITSYGDFLKKSVLKFYQKLKKEGRNCELFYIDKKPASGNKLTHVFNVLQPWWEESIAANRAMAEFFEKAVAEARL